MSCAGEPEPSQEQGAPAGPAGEDNPVQDLGKLREKLEGVLRAVAKSARTMDESAEHANQLAQDIYSLASEKIFVADQLDPGRYEDVHRLFVKMREEEDDTYYIYRGVLERQDTQSKGDLTLDQAAADLEVVARRRRTYIQKLQGFKGQVVTIEGYLSGRITPPEQAPATG